MNYLRKLSSRAFECKHCRMVFWNWIQYLQHHFKIHYMDYLRENGFIGGRKK